MVFLLGKAVMQEELRVQQRLVMNCLVLVRYIITGLGLFFLKKKGTVENRRRIFISYPWLIFV